MKKYNAGKYAYNKQPFDKLIKHWAVYYCIIQLPNKTLYKLGYSSNMRTRVNSFGKDSKVSVFILDWAETQSAARNIEQVLLVPFKKFTTIPPWYGGKAEVFRTDILWGIVETFNKRIAYSFLSS